jgi:GH15 family glucan-1,4-alpha-glucosidase
MALNYGIIGNCRTAALVKEDASIEWCCFPRFDSPSVFAKILDRGAGSFGIMPDGKYRVKQEYVENTNVLQTTFYNGREKFLVIDYFPLFFENNKLKQVNAIHRIIKAVKGRPKIRVMYEPRLNYARGATKLYCENNVIVAKSSEGSLYLCSNLDCEKIINKETVELKEDVFFVVSYNKKEQKSGIKRAEGELNKTIDFWRNYVKERTIPKFYGEQHIVRSVLALKLLTYYESGAVIAAATTSIPEIIGEQRNWDYRYCWLRDASFTVDAFTKVCSFKEAEEFLRFLVRICKKCSVDSLNLQIMYDVEGETYLKEETLAHLEGYKNSKPVRIGNAAFSQLQIDVVGEVMDSIFHFFVTYNYIKKMTDMQFNLLKSLVNPLTKIWKEKDHGIWEFRNIKKHFVFSKLMAWVAIDRGIRVAEHFKKQCPLGEWRRVKDEIKQEILTKGWNRKKKSFIMYYGSDEIDASLLLMNYYGFISPKDERYISTVRAVERELTKEGFVYRYKMKDDFGYPKNPFTIASFWLIDALYAIGEKRKAIQMFKNVLKCSNHLRLFSEDIDIETKELTGNFPQAYTHIALINTAVLLSNKGLAKRPVCMPKLDV